MFFFFFPELTVFVKFNSPKISGLRFPLVFRRSKRIRFISHLYGQLCPVRLQRIDRTDFSRFGMWVFLKYRKGLGWEWWAMPIKTLSIKMCLQVYKNEYDTSPAFCLYIDNCTDVMEDDKLSWCLYVHKERRVFHILKIKIMHNKFVVFVTCLYLWFSNIDHGIYC